MIVKLQFDLFYSVIKISKIKSIEIDYDDLYIWLEQNDYVYKFDDGTIGYAFDDDSVITWLKEKVLINQDIELLEKHNKRSEASKFIPDQILFF